MIKKNKALKKRDSIFWWLHRILLKEYYPTSKAVDHLTRICCIYISCHLEILLNYSWWVTSSIMKLVCLLPQNIFKGNKLYIETIPRIFYSLEGLPLLRGKMKLMPIFCAILLSHNEHLRFTFLCIAAWSVNDCLRFHRSVGLVLPPQVSSSWNVTI